MVIAQSSLPRRKSDEASYFSVQGRPCLLLQLCQQLTSKQAPNIPQQPREFRFWTVFCMAAAYAAYQRRLQSGKDAFCERP